MIASFDDIIAAIEEQKHLEILEPAVGSGYIDVKNLERKEVYRLEFPKAQYDSIKGLLRVLNGGKPQPLYQLTRIVGYYSPTRQWNKSKKAELKDRQRGLSVNT